jgi:hypothetical protein
MSKVEEIEKEIRALSPEQFAAFRNWFLDFEAEQWDRQIERDAQSGRLDELASKALRDHQGGKSSDL